MLPGFIFSWLVPQDPPDVLVYLLAVLSDGGGFKMCKELACLELSVLEGFKRWLGVQSYAGFLSFTAMRAA